MHRVSLTTLITVGMVLMFAAAAFGRSDGVDVGRAPTAAGTDVVHITPAGGGSTPINIPITQAQIDGNMTREQKAAHIANCINAFRKNGQQPFTATVTPAGGHHVQIRDGAGQACGIGWTNRTGERTDSAGRVMSSPDLARMAITGSITGLQADGSLAWCDFGTYDTVFSVETGGFLSLDALRTYVVATLNAGGINASIDAQGEITFDVGDAEGGVTFGTDDAGLESYVGLED